MDAYIYNIYARTYTYMHIYGNKLYIGTFEYTPF